MLNLDLAGLPDAEIEMIVAERCSDLGSVDAVWVYRAHYPDEFPFALVSMSSPDEVERVAQKVGDFIFGRAALVKLMQDPNDK